MKRTTDRNLGAGAGLIDRRSFLLKAGLLTAGSAFGGSLEGCGVDVFIIPCLGPAAAPVPVPGMTYIRASQLGCALDCSLQDGRNKYHGGKATDDAPKINAAMAAATADHPITLIIDGSALISGLFMPAGGHWSIAGLGCGTGFFVKSGIDNDGIHNGGPNAAAITDPGPPAPARGRNVSLSNFTLNGNGNGSHGVSTTGARQGTTGAVWYFGINLMNLDNITLDKVVVVNPPAYHIRLSNVGHVTATGCVMKTKGGGGGDSTDGLHFDGPANDIAIANCDFTTNDDSIALNCPEGYSGDISRVAVSNCTFNSWSLMRMYTVGNGRKFNIKDVSVGNCSGTLYAAGFLIGLSSDSNPDSIDAVTISDCTLTAPAVLEIAENFGGIELKNVNWTPVQSNMPAGVVRPSQFYPKTTFVGSSLALGNCALVRSSGIDAAALVLGNNSMLGNLEFDGFAMQDTGSHSPTGELVDIESGSIGRLVLNSVDSSNIKAPISAGGFASVGSVSGAGVLATQWEFPDAVMANEVPYISANSGLPSIKIDNVVEPYPQD